MKSKNNWLLFLFCIFTISSLFSFEFTIENDDFKIEKLREKGIEASKIVTSENGRVGIIGNPDLPIITKYIAIPVDGDYDITIKNIKEEVIEDISILPLQNYDENNIEQRNIIKNESVYSVNEFYPKEIFRTTDPVYLRDMKLIPIVVNPFRYNPVSKELIITKECSFNVEFSTESAADFFVHEKISPVFEPFYRDMVENYNELSRNIEYSQPVYLIIYPEVNSILSMVNELADWKTQKGYNVISVSTAETGTSSYNIKNYIQSLYNNEDTRPDFIALIGDASGSISIPTGSYDSGEGDQMYTILEGNDLLGDAFIGRLSVSNSIEFRTVLNKIFQYEKNPVMDNTEWYEKALLVGDPTTSGPSCVDTNIQINHLINYHNPNITTTEVYSGNFSNQMYTQLNSGMGFFNYRGWYGMSGFDTNNIYNLNNTNQLTVCVFITCGVGNFASESACRSEAFLRHGTPNDLKGGIAAIATSTSHTHTTFNNIVDGGIYHGIFAKKIYNLGAALGYGKYCLFTAFPNNPANNVNKFSTWNNLMGDPALEVWTSVPQQFNVNYESAVNKNSDSFAVTVYDQNNLPLKNALVNFWVENGGDDYIRNIKTDENGIALIPIENIPDGNALMTITAHDYKPFIQELPIVENNIEVLSVVSGGEEIDGISPNSSNEINLKLKNNLSSNIENVSLTITSLSEGLSFNTTQLSLEEIASNTNVLTDEIELNLTNEFNGNDIASFKVDISYEGESYSQILSLPIIASDWEINEISYSGVNGILNPGMQSNIDISIKNIGSVNSAEVTATLSCADNRIEIIEDEISYPNANIGEISNSSESFVVNVSSSVIPSEKIEFILELENGTQIKNLSFVAEVGTPTISDPVGPDSYGYMIFDDEDPAMELYTQYDWINIISSGTNLNLHDTGDEGDHEVIDLPFDLMYYGEEYNQITVCSNGWISPGSTEHEGYMNWYMPSPLGPNPIIAVFWDDLKSLNGVYYQYFPNEGYFVVEWDVNNSYNNATERFEIIIYNQSQLPTITGDNAMKMQYHTINNVNVGSYEDYSVNHGQYATVGVEDASGLIGLEYTYNNTYPVQAKELENEMALLVTTGIINSEDPYLVVLPNNFDFGNIYMGQNLEFSFHITNYGNSPLHINSISSNDENVNLSYDISNELDYGQSIQVLCSLDVEELGDYESFINIESNCSNEVQPVRISYTASYGASAEVDLDNIYIQMEENSSIESEINISNEGLGTLIYNASVKDVMNNVRNEYIPAEKDGLQPVGSVNLRNFGGPDDFGYRWIDSNEENGPNFDWVEIASVGNEINFNSDDDMTVPLELGFQFPFYGNSYSQIKVCGNGFLTFTSNSTDWNNQQLPSDSNPNNIIAPFWDDLSPQIAGDVYYYQDEENSRFIVEFKDVIHYQGQYNGTYSFQAILYPNGKIVFQYDQLSGDIDTCTIGIEDASGEVGLTIAYNTSYLENELAITIISEPEWLGLSNASGSLESMDSDQIGLTIDTEDLDEGTYNKQIVINTNDPNHEQIIIPVTLVVGAQSEASVSINITGDGTTEVTTGTLTLEKFPFEEGISYTQEINGAAGYEFNVLKGTYRITAECIGFNPYIIESQVIAEDTTIEISLNTVGNENDINQNYITKFNGNYPNPFNPITNLSFSLREESNVNISIYNIKGQLIKTLVNKKYLAGNHIVTWNGKDDNNSSVASGVYFSLFKANNRYTSVKKMILLK